MSVDADLQLRAMLDTDRHFVLNSWLRSYAGRAREARDYASLDAFYRDYAPVVSALLDRSQVIIASLRESPDVIVAWAAIEDDSLHYVLTKPRWRRLGVARWMLQDFASMPLTYTHRTSDAMRCPVPSNWAYRRFKIWPKEIAA